MLSKQYPLKEKVDSAVNVQLPGDAKWPFDPLVGGHLNIYRVTKNCQVWNRKGLELSKLVTQTG